jgi:hypothetical protein
MSDKTDYQPKNSDLFKWYGWGSPVGFGLFIVSCALAVFLLACAGSLFVEP